MRRAALDRTRPAAARGTRGRAASIPQFIAPQLASLAAVPPAGGDWRYEIKYDGYRLAARIGGRVRLLTRSGKDWTERLPRLARSISGLRLTDTWLDGEIVVLGAQGIPSFQALQNAFEAGSDAQVVYFVFDLPHLRRRDLRRLPLLERKRELARVLADATGPARYSGDVGGDIEAALGQACRLGLEGLIAKRANAAYTSGRGRAWLKLKCRPRQEFVIGGYTTPAGSRHGFGALLLGYHDAAGRLGYAGRAGTGFDGATLSHLAQRLGKLQKATSPFDDDPGPAARRGVHWVRPELVAEVEFTGWTDERLLRQASFIALRSDKSASAVQREAAIVPTKSAVTGDAARAPVRVAGVTISHPQRPIWPAEAIDKAALARYHERVGPWLLPQLKSRPLSLLRCPYGVEASCFFQRHMAPARPQGVKTFIWQRSTAGKSYLFVDTLPAVIQLVQHGVVELHTWGATMPRPDRPDRITIDLDSDPDLPWERVAEAAQLVRALVEEVGLHAFAKTTGGKGLHVVVPLLRRQGWDEVKSFARAIAEDLAGAMPDRFTASIARQQRAGRIFVDYLRNGESATAVAAYSVRARPGAPVSMPIRWEDLAEDVRGSRFNLTNVPDLLARQRRDPWAGYAQAARGLTRAMLRALGVVA